MWARGASKRCELLMERLEVVAILLDSILSSKRRKHIVGGVLMSVSLLFGGLAFTVITLKPEEEVIDEQMYI